MNIFAIGSVLMNKKIYNIFCDESCHLESDDSDVMLLGAITCSEERKKEHYEAIRKLKLKHGMSSWKEIKWVRVSKSKVHFYEELLDYFFDSDDLGFRVIVMSNKKKLDHSRFGNSHDMWYYHMYYYLLNPLIRLNSFNETYRIFLDIKDTNGGSKIDELTSVLCSKKRVSRQKINDIKQILSHESELLQLADLLIGAIGYYHRGFYAKEGSSYAKNYIVNDLIKIFNIDFEKSTRPDEKKFNIFLWSPR